MARMLVVVPARDEAATVGACVESVLAAVDELARVRPALTVRVVVVADACRDATAAAARTAGAEVVELDAAAVGAARQRGVDHALAGQRDAATWVASTDADTVVPRGWLIAHLTAAEAGAELLVGAVEPDPADVPPRTLAAWHAAHDGLPPGASIHGANLGVRADVLARVGGFAAVPLQEDVDLVTRLRAAGAVEDTRSWPPVRTSGRTRNRVAGGFGGYLAALTSEDVGA